MPEFRVKKSLSKITKALEALIEAVEAHHDLNVVREPNEGCIHMSYERRNPQGSYLLRGLTILSSLLRINRLGTNLAKSSSTDFPESKTDDSRSLANTSGDTSLKI
jgi:hypothetical protein